MNYSISDEQKTIGVKFQDLAKNANLDLPMKEIWKQELVLELQKLIELCLNKEQDAFLNLVVAFEAITQALPKVGKIFSIGAHFFGSLFPIFRFGSLEQKGLYLDKLLCGDYVGGIAITELGSGSDVGNISTSYDHNVGDNSYIISGEKEFITNAPISDLLIVFASDKSKQKSLYNISAFIVELSDPGVEVEKSLIRGLDGISIGKVKLSNVQLDKNRLLSKEGRGLMIFNYVMQLERTCLLALLIGIMKRQIAESVEYVNSRSRFNRTLSSFQSVSNRIVDMQVRLEASQLMLYKTARALDKKDKSYSLDIFSVSKLFISECSVLSSIDYFKTLGGSAGYIDSKASVDIIDSLLSTTFSGTSDIQRIIIARNIGLKI